jgi:hypothetical protein
MQRLGRFASRDRGCASDEYKCANTISRHRPPPGRRIAPPDDRLRRAIQYSETPMMESRGRGVLDTPLSRSMTALFGAARQPKSVPSLRDAATNQSMLSSQRDGLLRHRPRLRDPVARNDGKHVRRRVTLRYPPGPASHTQDVEVPSRSRRGNGLGFYPTG